MFVLAPLSIVLLSSFVMQGCLRIRLLDMSSLPKTILNVPLLPSSSSRESFNSVTTLDNTDNDISGDEDDDDQIHHIFWNILRIAAHEETIQAIQGNPDLAKYVTNMITAGPETVVGTHYQLNDEDDGDVNNSKKISKGNKIIQLGVIADWVMMADGNCAKIVQPGVGAAWIQTWNNFSNNNSASALENRGYGWVRDDIPELAMGVLPAYQGRGIGTQLLTTLIQHVNNLNQHRDDQPQSTIPGISLSVREDNVPAIRLYQRNGFQQVPGTNVPNRVGTMSYTMIRWFGVPSSSPTCPEGMKD
jgi:ribosomal protein S18 acetylase RimI-like enzyme